MIMSVIRILFLSLIFTTIYLAGCSGTPANSSEIVYFVKEFEKDIGVSAKRVRIYFDDLDGNKAGSCIPGVGIVRLDRETYFNLSRIEKKALIYHELGHCACHILSHNPRQKSTCSGSIMSPSMDSAWCYAKNWKFYVKGLKEQCK